MCTAIFYKSSGSFFGRTLDHPHSYGEAPMMIRKGYRIKLRRSGELSFLGDAICMGIERDGFPLIFDGVNEFGVAVAGLNFPRSARFFEEKKGYLNLASYEVIPYILAAARSAEQAYDILTRVNITPDKFDTDTDGAALHFMVSDKDRSIIAEQTDEGMRVYSDRFGALTNEPPYPAQCLFMNRYKGLSNRENQCAFFKEDPISFGEGSIGLPGDLSSPSRFARAAFGIRFGTAGCKEEELTTAMHILESVSVIRGTVKDGKDGYKTQYLSLMDLDSFSYYYRRYDDFSLNKVSENALPDTVLSL